MSIFIWCLLLFHHLHMVECFAELRTEKMVYMPWFLDTVVFC
jgi:hypothetical protein